MGSYYIRTVLMFQGFPGLYTNNLWAVITSEELKQGWSQQLQLVTSWTCRHINHRGSGNLRMNSNTIEILLQQLKTQVTKSQLVKSWITLLVMTVNSKYTEVKRKPQTTHQYLHYTHSVDQLRRAGDLKSQRHISSTCQ